MMCCNIPGRQHTGLCLHFLFIAMMILPGISCNKYFDEPPTYTGPAITATQSMIGLRKLHFPGNFEQILDDQVIVGVVIADDRTDNFYKSVVLQDSTGGVVVRLDASGLFTDYPIGTKLAVKLRGLWLGDYAGLLQIGSGVDRTDQLYTSLSPIPVPLFSRYLVKISANQKVLPRLVKFDQLNDSLQSCLVTLQDIEFAVGDTGKPFADVINKQSANRVLKVCNGGSIYLRTGGFANFANVKTPRGNGTITAVLSFFKTEKQLLIRDTSDLHFNGFRCMGSASKILLTEDFENSIVNKDLLVAGWKNIVEIGNQFYQGKLSNSNQYAEITALASIQPKVVSWLISPAFNLSGTVNELLSFQSKDGFDNGASLQVFVSTNHDGGTMPWKAKWVALKVVLSKGNIAGIAKDWVFSGNSSLNSFAGTAYIAFRYEGGDPVNPMDKRTTRFQIDNVRIVGN